MEKDTNYSYFCYKGVNQEAINPELLKFQSYCGGRFNKSDKSITMIFPGRAETPADIYEISHRMENYVYSVTAQSLIVRPRDVVLVSAEPSNGRYTYRSVCYSYNELPEDNDDPEIITVSYNGVDLYFVSGLPRVILEKIDTSAKQVDVTVNGPIDNKDIHTRFLLSLVMMKALKEKFGNSMYYISAFTIFNYPDTPEINQKYGTHLGIYVDKRWLPNNK